MPSHNELELHTCSSWPVYRNNSPILSWIINIKAPLSHDYLYWLSANGSGCTIGYNSHHKFIMLTKPIFSIAPHKVSIKPIELQSVRNQAYETVILYIVMKFPAFRSYKASDKGVLAIERGSVKIFGSNPRGVTRVRIRNLSQAIFFIQKHPTIPKYFLYDIHPLK